jgi:hypothetical protein
MTKIEFDEPSKGRVIDKELPLEPAQPGVFNITQTNPPNGATGVDQSSSFNVTFNKPVGGFSVDNNILMNITTPPVVLGTHVPGTKLLSTDGKTIVYKPLEPLQSGLSYTVTVKSRMQATTFEFLGSEHVFSFITGGPPNPNTCNFLLAHPKKIVDVTAKSSESTFPAKNAIDENLNTKWMSTSTLKPWIKADLQHEFPVCKVDIAWADGSSRQYRFIISVSSDGTNFVKVFSGNSTGTTNSLERYSFAETNARYVRIMLSENTDSVAQISEMAVIGRWT